MRVIVMVRNADADSMYFNYMKYRIEQTNPTSRYMMNLYLNNHRHETNVSLIELEYGQNVSTADNINTTLETDINAKDQSNLVFCL